VERLGQALFHDPTLSNPKGVSCSECHFAQAGWTYSDSEINLLFGPVPGAVINRFGNRRPPTVAYAAFLPSGPPAPIPNLGFYVGGFFYDGRAATLADQAPAPLQGPNEMNNTPRGVVAAVASGNNAELFEQAFGANINSLSVDTAFSDIVDALVAYEHSTAVSPFNSKYDRYLAGETELSQQELAGLQLFTGSTTGRPGGPATQKQANCVTCHSIPATVGETPDLFTGGVFLNTGIPKNPNNPYYKQTSASADPQGYNPLGGAYIDYGLGDFLYPDQNTLPSGNIGAGSNGKGDFLAINGTFKTPTVRNVDLRPDANFVKCYGHNGFFKSLPQIVHFYNTRNLTTVPGEVIDFTKPKPYAGLKGRPLWPAPEYPSATTLVNPKGLRSGLIGNLGLTAEDEANLVAFLKTLSDEPAPAPANQPPAPPPLAKRGPPPPPPR
jgi:cytochrome c peroxidase